MVIRCERCSTLYELDEALLSPSGSEVQCTRCQHVFTAYPPRAAGRTLVGVPAQAPEAPQPSEKPDVRIDAPAATTSTSAAAPPNAPPASAVPSARPETRAVRSGPPPVYRPAAVVPGPAAGRAPLLRRDAVGTFEARLRWSARWKWLAPAIGVVVIAAGVAGWLVLSRRTDPVAPRARAGAFALVSLDDAASVEQAVSQLEELLRAAPKHRGAAADRALAQVLRAGTLVDEGEALAARVASRGAERDRLLREQPPGWEDAERAAAAEARALEPEVRAREERARALAGAAFEALRRLQEDGADAPEVARGLAAYYALGGERDRARKTIRVARERAPADPWLDLAEAWADMREADRAARERALVELGALSSAHPELLRGRYLLARAQATLGRRGEALATLDALLAVNARHEGARRLKDELSVVHAPPPPPVAALPAPPPEKPAPQRRKAVAHPALVPLPVPEAEVPQPAAPDPAATPQDPPPATAADPAMAPASPGSGPPPAPQGAGAAPPPKRRPDHHQDPDQLQINGG